jgi:hypothetical protein
VPPWPSGRGHRSASLGVERRSEFAGLAGVCWSISISLGSRRRRDGGRRPPLAIGRWEEEDDGRIRLVSENEGGRARASGPREEKERAGGL